MTIPLHHAAKCLNGEVSGGQVLCPGPGHSTRDRSLSVRFSPSAPDGFVVHSFAGDDPFLCRDHVRHLLGLAGPSSNAPVREYVRGPAAPSRTRNNGEKAQFLWHRARHIKGSLGEHYLRAGRSIHCALPPTLRFLEPTDQYPPTVIAAFALPLEREPGAITMDGVVPHAVHLTRLTPDGLSRTEKRILGSPNGTPIVCSPWTDSLGLIVCEGIEDALSAFEAMGVAAWAAGSASYLPSLARTVPDWADSIAIVEDDDPAGHRGVGAFAHALAQRRHSVDVIRLGGMPGRRG